MINFIKSIQQQLESKMPLKFVVKEKLKLFFYFLLFLTIAFNQYIAFVYPIVLILTGIAVLHHISTIQGSVDKQPSFLLNKFEIYKIKQITKQLQHYVLSKNKTVEDRANILTNFHLLNILLEHYKQGHSVTHNSKNINAIKSLQDYIKTTINSTVINDKISFFVDKEVFHLNEINFYINLEKFKNTDNTNQSINFLEKHHFSFSPPVTPLNTIGTTPMPQKNNNHLSLIIDNLSEKCTYIEQHKTYINNYEQFLKQVNTLQIQLKNISYTIIEMQSDKKIEAEEIFKQISNQLNTLLDESINTIEHNITKELKIINKVIQQKQ